jgi:hypothetical protein
MENHAHNPMLLLKWRYRFFISAKNPQINNLQYSIFSLLPAVLSTPHITQMTHICQNQHDEYHLTFFILNKPFIRNLLIMTYDHPYSNKSLLLLGIKYLRDSHLTE